MRKLSVTLACVSAAVIFASFAVWCVLSKDASALAVVCAAVCSVVFLVMLLNILPRFLSFFTSPDTVAPYELQGERSRRFLHPWFKLSIGVLAFRVALVIIAYAVFNAKFGFSETVFASFADIWILPDPVSRLTLGIVNGGYSSAADFAVPPLLPLLIRGMNYITSSSVLSSFILSSAVCCALGIAVYELALMDLPKRQARFAVLLLMLMPSSLSLLKPMDATALFMLLCALCLIALRRNNFAVAGVFSLLASAACVWGGILIIIISAEFIRRIVVLKRSGDSLRLKRCVVSGVTGVFISLIGALLPFAFALFKCGNAALPLSGEYSAFSDGIRPFFAGGGILLGSGIAAPANVRTAQLLNVCLPSFIAAFILPILFAAAAKRLRASYSALFAVWYLLLLGFGRLEAFMDTACAMPIVFTAAACVCESRRSRAAVSAVCGASMLLRLVTYIIL